MKKTISLIGAVVLLVTALAAAALPAGSPAAAAQTSSDLEGSRWRLVSYIDEAGKPAEVIAEAIPTAEFSGSNVFGSTGCNTYTAPYEAGDGALSVGITATTMKLCDAAIMDQEAALLKDIQAAASYQIIGSQLSILDKGGTVVLTFQAESPEALTAQTWVLAAYNNGRGGVQSALETARVTAAFDENNRVAGNAGCNSYTATYAVDGAKIQISPAMATRKACQASIMAQEVAYFEALRAAVTFETGVGELTIRDAEGATLLLFQVEEPAALTGAGWTMTAFNNGQEAVQSALADIEVTALFGDDGTITGSSGCNTYAAPYKTEGAKVEIGAARSTRMMCEQPVMDQENAYLDALMSAAGFTIEGEALTLRTAEGAIAVAFVRTPETRTLPEDVAPKATVTPAAPVEMAAEAVYVALLPTADAGMLSVALVLQPDGTAEFSRDAGAGGRSVETGGWEADGEDGYVVTLLERDGAALNEPVVMTFQRQEGYLALVEEDGQGAWGENGLKLNQSADAVRQARVARLAIDLAAGFPLDPAFVSVSGGGEVDARLLGSGCIGYIQRQPVVTVKWSGEADLLRAFFYSDGDPTLVVLTPEGELLCHDNAHAQLLDPFIEVKAPAAGEYRIWVGSAARNQLIPGVLVLTTNPEVDLGTFALGKLIQRPSIPQKPDEGETSEQPPLPLSAERVVTRYGDYTACLEQEIHQANCFVSDGTWGSPDLGSVQMEPPIEVWTECTPADSDQVFYLSPTGPAKTYRCSKTLAGWFPK